MGATHIGKHIAEYMIARPDEPLPVVEVATALNLKPGQVQSCFNEWIRNGTWNLSRLVGGHIYQWNSGPWPITDASDAPVPPPAAVETSAAPKTAPSSAPGAVFEQVSVPLPDGRVMLLDESGAIWTATKGAA